MDATAPVIAAVTAIAVSLNGAPLELDPPAIVATFSPWQDRHVMIPVAPFFAELGWQAAPRARADGTAIDLTDVKGGWLRTAAWPGQREVKIREYVAQLPVPTVMHNGELYASMLFCKIAAGARLAYDPEAGRLAVQVDLERKAPLVTVAEITADLGKWLHQRVRLKTHYIGAQGDASWPATAQGPPVECALAFRDATGAIYYAECEQMWTRMMCLAPFWEDMGGKPEDVFSLAGVVRLGYGDVPYIQGTRCGWGSHIDF